MADWNQSNKKSEVFYVEPRKSKFGKGEILSRGLFADEKDRLTSRSIQGFFNSTITIGSTGVMTVTLSILGHKLFGELVDFCNQWGLAIDKATLSGELLIVKIAFVAGVTFTLVGIMNILTKADKNN